jgi:hypothetical protein
MRFGAVAIVGVLALLATGCGDDGGSDRPASAETASAAKVAIGAERATESKPAGPGRRCRRSLGEFLDAIESLANSVAVGLDYERYLDSVGRVRATYASVDAERLGLVCLGRVAGPAEGSLNAYIDAANAWGECLAESSCETAAVEPRLQRKWEAAEDLLAQASDGLRPVPR